MSLNYVFRRFGVFLLIVWAGATINFLMPRMAPVNPIRERLLQAVSFGGAGKTDMEAVVATYEARFRPRSAAVEAVLALPRRCGAPRLWGFHCQLSEPRF